MIGIIGAGNMGEALIKGIGGPITASDAKRLRLGILKKRYNIKISASNRELARRCRIIILAVKPKDLDEVLSEIAPFMGRRKLIVSIAAGIKTSHIEKRLPGKTAVIRAMPNMPALIGKGISAASAGRFAEAADKRAASKIFSCVGEVVWVNERLMDAVTAVSGSGPAYFFFLIEMLIAAGVRRGLSRGIARKLAVNTAFGAAALALKAKQEPATLRRKVASKGGTTEAAFSVFQREDFGGIVRRAVDAAVKRSKELSKK